jgi:hypothetical protein
LEDDFGIAAGSQPCQERRNGRTSGFDTGSSGECRWKSG